MFSPTPRELSRDGFPVNISKERERKDGVKIEYKIEWYGKERKTGNDKGMDWEQ